jgi:hypothetical protein
MMTASCHCCKGFKMMMTQSNDDDESDVGRTRTAKEIALKMQMA